MRLLHRQRRDPHGLARARFADLDRFAGPGPLHQVERLDEALALRAGVDAERGEQRGPETAAEAEDDAAVREAVEYGDLLSRLEGVADRQQIRGRAEA
jgi:hypothetical protein